MEATDGYLTSPPPTVPGCGASYREEVGERGGQEKEPSGSLQGSSEGLRSHHPLRAGEADHSSLIPNHSEILYLGVLSPNLSSCLHTRLAKMLFLLSLGSVVPDLSFWATKLTKHFERKFLRWFY